MENYCEDCGAEINFRRHKCEKCSKKNKTQKFISNQEVNGKCLKTITIIDKNFRKFVKMIVKESESLANLRHKRVFNEDGEIVLTKKLSEITSFKINLISDFDKFLQKIDDNLLDDKIIFGEIKK